MHQTKQTINKDLKEFIKNVIPLMSIDDLSQALVLKCFADKSELTRTSNILGVQVGNCEFEIKIKKVNGGAVLDED